MIIEWYISQVCHKASIIPTVLKEGDYMLLYNKPGTLFLTRDLQTFVRLLQPTPPSLTSSYTDFSQKSVFIPDTDLKLTPPQTCLQLVDKPICQQFNKKVETTKRDRFSKKSVKVFLWWFVMGPRTEVGIEPTISAMIGYLLLSPFSHLVITVQDQTILHKKFKFLGVGLCFTVINL